VNKDDIRVLVVDDSVPVCRIAEDLLRRHGYSVITGHDGAEAIKLVEEQFPDLVLMDINMPNVDGIEALKYIMKRHPAMAVIMMSGHDEAAPAVEAMKQGARDYLKVPLDADELELKVNRVLEEAHLKCEVGRLQTILGHSADLCELMGYSSHILAIYEQISTVAHTDFTVIIHGESGSGKELVARAIHDNSRRAAGPFVPIDCGSIPENLIESELFGHERGAFTGAYERKKGSFERASTGTLLLDEIGNLPKTMQSKLLRALQERKIERIGGDGPIDVDIRIIAAGNRRLHELIDEGKFREDLYHRLNEFVIEIPPLRRRKDDLIYLAKRFMDATAKELKKEVRGISEPALQLMLDYDWPGNVRELRNAIRRAVLLCDDIIRPQHLTALSSAASTALPAFKMDAALQMPLKEIVRNASREIERKVIAQALEKTGGNKSQAARMLQIDYKTILTKINEYNLGTSRTRKSSKPQRP